MICRMVLLLALLWTPEASGAPLFGSKWGSPVLGTGASVSYSFVTPGTFADEANHGNIPGPSVGYDAFLGDRYRDAVAEAFDTWSIVADLSFIEVADSGAPFNEPGGGDIRFWGATADPANIAWAYFPNPDPAGGDIFINSVIDFAVGEGGGDGFRFDWAVFHEIGHSLGLMHDPDPTSAMYAFYPVGRGRLNAEDIASIRRLYGPAQVPAPAAIGMFGLGLLVLARRRRTAGRKPPALPVAWS